MRIACIELSSAHGCREKRRWNFHLMDNRFVACTGTNSDREVYLCKTTRPEPELKDMSIKGLSASFTQVIDPDQFRELLAPGSNFPKGLS